MKKRAMKIATYQQAGVDLNVGDAASRLLFDASKLTWENRRGLPGEVSCSDDFFGAVRAIQASRFPDALVGMNFDGIGTKVEIAERVGDFSTLAFDLFAMVCDDAAIRGAEPVSVGSILDCNVIDLSVIEQLAKGMVEAARAAKVAVINGEVAELGTRVSGFGQSSVNWGASVYWIARPDRLITGRAMSSGQSIVGFQECGLRSNGVSLVRHVFSSAC